MAGADGLSGDLLGVIYRCFSSPYDRARFAAVCTSWRAVTSWHPKLPALPLLFPSTGNDRRDYATRAYSPEDNRVLRAPLPWFPYGKRIVGCHDGGWVAATMGTRVEVVNLFTREWVLDRDFSCGCLIARRGARETRKISLDKVVFSKEPTSKGCIMAAISTTCRIAVCRHHGWEDGGWTTWGCGAGLCPNLADIVFCNGDLYGLSSHDLLLHRFSIGLNNYGDPVIATVHRLTIETPGRSLGYRVIPDMSYIFGMSGKLTIAMKVHDNCKPPIFKVFELVDVNETQLYRFKWMEITSLGDHALFLGPGCCKAMPVSTGGMLGVVDANRIYYSSPYCDVDCFTTLDLGSCIVYCWESDGVNLSESIMSRGYHYREKDDKYYYDEKNSGNGYTSCTWILPPHF